MHAFPTTSHPKAEPAPLQFPHFGSVLIRTFKNAPSGWRWHGPAPGLARARTCRTGAEPMLRWRKLRTGAEPMLRWRKYRTGADPMLRWRKYRTGAEPM